MLPLSARGFSLLDALVASLLVSVAVVAMAHLIAAAAAQTFTSRQAETALVLAQGKLEELRSLSWRFSASGERISSTALAPSPPLSLTENHDGYAESLDRFGSLVAPAGAQYIRRWAISAFASTDPDTLLLESCVFSRQRAVTGGRAEACVWTLRTRTP